MKLNIDINEIAFDFDGVVADTMGLFVEMIKSDYGRNDITLEAITDYDLTKCLDISENILIDIGTKIMSENCADYLKPIEGSVDVLRRYIDNSEKLLIVTARPEKRPVELWVKKYLNADDSMFEVVATGDYNSKAEVLLASGKKYFIEDRIETCFYLKDKGLEPVVFVQPWNRKPNNFLEVNSWFEISEIFCS